jgi:hypothetical protein
MKCVTRTFQPFSLLVVAIALADCSSGAGTDTSDQDGGADTDTCSDTELGLGDPCETEAEPCICDNVCSDELFSDTTGLTGFTCHAPCSEDDPCADETQVCMLGDTEATTGACVPTGAVPTLPFSTKLWVEDHQPTYDDVTSVDGAVDLNGNSWAVTWVVGIEIYDEQSDQDLVLILFGGSPTGVLYRELYVQIPAESFAEGTLPLVDEDAPEGEGNNFYIYLVEYEFGEGFETDPTSVSYLAFGVGGELTLDSIGEVCAEEPCEAGTSGSIEADLVLLEAEIVEY